MINARRWSSTLALLALSCAVVCGEDDLEFLPQELAATAQRLMSLHTVSQGAGSLATHTVSDLAIPTQAYENAYADMRQPETSLPASSEPPIKLALPSFALKETASNGQQRQAALQAVHHEAAKTTDLSRKGVDSVMKTLLGDKSEQTVAMSASSAALASVDPSKAKALAMARLAAKHGALNRKPLQGPTDDDAVVRAHIGGKAIHPGQGHAKFDKTVSKYHGWLAKAVMILAIVAGSCICIGICSVIYCWSKRDKTVPVGMEPQSKEEKFNGKNYGRATPQYGSYGAGRRR